MGCESIYNVIAIGLSIQVLFFPTFSRAVLERCLLDIP